MNWTIDKNFRDLLQDAVDRAGTQKKLANAAKIPESNIGKYLSGEVKNIQNRTYQKLLPFLKIKEHEDEKNQKAKSKSKFTPAMIEIFELLEENDQQEILTICSQKLLNNITGKHHV